MVNKGSDGVFRMEVKESSVSLTEELEKQKREIQPIIDFYDRLVKGWHFRIIRAEIAMKDPGNQSEAQQKVFIELRDFAKSELEQHLPVFNEVSEMKKQIEQRIQQFDLMRFQNKLTASISTPVSLDFKDAQELIYKADALIELRTSEDQPVL